jgi:hypothetical protein
MHLFEGQVPAGPGFGSRPDEQLSLLNNEIDLSVQLTLLNDGFGNPDPLGVSDSYDVRFHCSTLALMVSIECNYIVPIRVVNSSKESSLNA